MRSKIKNLVFAGLVAVLTVSSMAAESEMDEMWGKSEMKLRSENPERGKLFMEGNYAMFIHWGLYSQLGNKVDGKTYYGIGEWIMNPRMAGIPVDEYKKMAKTFNPEKFDATAIARLAKDAGMKYIVLTSKHHEGFAMYHSKVSDFNIYDATPWKRDPLKELAEACRKEGIGLGVYYSHFQDWTAPGGGRGPQVDPCGKPVSFDEYFNKKCLPQVIELTTQYGPLELIWFDTPADIEKKYVDQLVAVVRKNQPNALINGRIGHGEGDLRSLGDMEVPHRNVAGLWESVDTTNDSWAYAWYDEYWKTPEEILSRLIACVARGGTYMLNIGPRGDGSVPERAARSLRESGKWIHRYPQVVYGADASPWKHALPWGDVTVKGNKLYLSVFEWPTSGKLCLPGLKTKIVAANLLKGSESESITYETSNGWTLFDLPLGAPEKRVSVIEVELADAPEADPTFGIDPDIGTEILVEFAAVEGVELSQKRWMEKFGEWKSVYHARNWTPGGKAIFEINVLEPGDYNASLTYAGEGRLVWGVEVVGGEHIQNEQNSSHNYQEFPIGWINFPQPGKYKVAVSCLEGDGKTSSLKSIVFEPIH